MLGVGVVVMVSLILQSVFPDPRGMNPTLVTYIGQYHFEPGSLVSEPPVRVCHLVSNSVDLGRGRVGICPIKKFP